MPSSTAPPSRLSRLVIHGTLIEPHERKAVLLAFLCYFVLFASYYILRPVRDTVATVFGVDGLNWLFTGTFIGTVITSPVYAWLASRMKLRRFLPAVLWFWLLNVLGFAACFWVAPGSRLLAAIYYWWFSIANLFMISIFWSLMADLFATTQATRLFALIASGGSFGAICGPAITSLTVHAIGLSGVVLIAAAGFLGVIVLVQLLMREKERLRDAGEDVQQSTFDHGLAGNPFDGFFQVLKSAYSRSQAGFILLMTWANTVGYFLQTEVIAKAFSAVEARAVAIADISLVVNIITAIILFFGLGHFIRRFGVTATLVANPFILGLAFLALAFSPTLLMIQALQVVRQVTQYAIARPSREMCFTVVDQKDRYKTKNVIDVVVYRFGDLSSAWILTGLRTAGARVFGSSMAGVTFSVLWGLVALQLGRRYESRCALQSQPSPAPAQAVR